MLKNRLPTLQKCVDDWREREKLKIWLPATDPISGEHRNVEAPAWLFRGESSIYDDTYSSMHRFSLNKLTPTAQQQIEAVVKGLDSVLRDYGFSPMYSAALLQHYFLPTELIDMTSSLDAAAAFAAFQSSGTGTLMAFPTDVLAQHMFLIDLKEIDFARRPRHQSAFAVFHRKQANLKGNGLFKLLQAEKLIFRTTKLDLKKWNKHYEEICGPPHTDATSGLLNKLVDDVVLARSNHLLCPEARAWLEERIPWAPVPMKPVAGESGIMEPAWERF